MHKPRAGSWVEACVWNERMLAALGNGVKGGKWFSLIDKVCQPSRNASSGVAQSGCERRSGRGRSGRASSGLR